MSSRLSIPLASAALLWVAALLSACDSKREEGAAGAASPGPAAAAGTSTAPPTSASSAAPAALPSAASGRAANPAEACAGCHPDQTDHFAETGMGRAFYEPNARPSIENFDAKKATVVHPKTGAVYKAYIDAEGRWWQSESFPGRPGARAVEVKYVVGSGNHTRTYIGILEGEFVELPLTWYSRRAIWDMSPGYDTKSHFRFTRAVKPECLFCHNDLTPVVEGTMASYTTPVALGISCNRCHGDGAAHVALRESGKGPAAGQPDATILNPGRLSGEQQLGVCEQCHLAGETRVLLDGHAWDKYDPRTPLADYMSIYVKAGKRGQAFSIASHGDRLAQSPCAQQSGGRLTCTTCHNPHKPSTPKTHRDACLSCHKASECGEEHAAAKPDAECWPCHMRKGDTSDIPHVTFTDHWIRKRPGSKNDAGAVQANDENTSDLVDALASRRTVPDTRSAAREGVAHADVWRYHFRPDHLPRAAALLEAAVTTTRDRMDVWFSLARVREALGNRAGAARAYEEAVRIAPRHAPLLVDQAQNLEDMGNLGGAEKALRRALEVRPDYRVAWGNLANLLSRLARYREAEAAYQRADTLAPDEAVTPQNRAYTALARKEFAQAMAYFEEVQRRDPVTPMGPFGVANVLLAQGKVAEALPYLNEALRMDASYGMARWYRSRIYAEQGKFAEARADLESWRASEPQNPNAHLELARVLLGSGDKPAARNALSDAAMRFPGHPQVAALMQIAMQP